MQHSSQKGWPTIVNNKRLVADEMPLAFGAANRVLLPDSVGLLAWLQSATWERDASFLSSHLITAAMLAALRRAGREEFLHLRGQEIERVVREQGNRLAAWGEPDRVSIAQLERETVAA